jgi:hypothetical protein
LPARRTHHASPDTITLFFPTAAEPSHVILKMDPRRGAGHFKEDIMKTLGIPRIREQPVVQPVQGGTRLRTVLLACGILASLHYAAMLVFVPRHWKGYSSASQTVSELSAIGAPTRSLWVALAVVYTLLLVAFGWGVWRSAERSRALRVVGALLIASAVIGLFWPPMHLRGTEPTLTDTLHIVFAVIWNLLAVLTIVFAAAALGARFRLYSAVILATFVVFGILTGMEAPRIATNLPTPWIGVWERIIIGAFYLWLSALAVVLLRGRTELSRNGGGRSSDGG